MKSLRVVLLLPLLCSCGLSEAYVAADRATYNAIAPEYRAYVEADPALSAEQKARRERTIKAWDARLRAVSGG